MSKRVIMYNEQSGDVKFAQVPDDTFVLSQAADGPWKSMTYGEWEALRCEQACEAAKARVAVELPEAKRAAALAMLDAFTVGMRV
ncbi:hypothetical protein [uncultured Parolsenella sp.]|uniref:hypothetical protein n=1 Tax=uncultured Parolsenella sp. TaxID=2083008 RepID=UPI0027D94893|nr:hypothetical protein [uncultured Parolsenella sp.]